MSALLSAGALGGHRPGARVTIDITAQPSLQPQEFAFSASYCECTIPETKMDFASCEAPEEPQPQDSPSGTAGILTPAAQRLSGKVRMKKAVY